MFIIFSQLNPPFSGSYRIVKMPVSIYRVIFYRFNNLFVLRLPLHSNSTVYFIHRTQYLLQNLASFVKFFDNFGVLFTSQFFALVMRHGEISEKSEVRRKVIKSKLEYYNVVSYHSFRFIGLVI